MFIDVRRIKTIFNITLITQPARRPIAGTYTLPSPCKAPDIVCESALKISDIAISMPAIVGRDGVEGNVPIRLNDKEKAALKKSADTLKSVIDDVFSE